MIAIVADDLTGACDTTAKLSQKGILSQVLLDMPNHLQGIEDFQVIAINTNSRSLPPQEAYLKTKDTVDNLKRLGFKTFYKKIDSLFRGNVSVEIQAMIETLECDLAIIVSAVPNNNRKVIEGCLVAKNLPNNGIEISKSVFSDKIELYVNITLRTVRKGISEIRDNILKEYNQGKRIFLMDSDSEEDIKVIASACEELPYNVLHVGASSFIAPLSSNWNIQSCKATYTDELQEILQKNKSLLYVIGTNNPVSLDQVRYMINQENIPSVKIDVRQCATDKRNAEIERCLNEADIMFTSSPETFLIVVDSINNDKVIKRSRNNGENSTPEITECFSEVVKSILQKHEFGVMVLAGGDTAQAVFDKINVNSMQILYEYAPGIPIAKIRLSDDREMLVVTKSGGFGEFDCLIGIKTYLNELYENGGKNHDQ